MVTRIAVDVGLVVANMEHSLGFYRDLLNLPVVAKSTTSLIGQGRMVQLRHGESLIKLIELDNVPSPQHSTEISTILGYRYMTLLVSELDAMMTRMVNNAVTIALSVTKLSNGTKIAMVCDPDGNIVEFVQEIN
ncbi:MAG: VOC family protein [Leptolyngbyaceae cyanobacterium MAG.088]|nr:VOC family protein [Leptolyngbyaceae cyanobacterium MAG.088]